MTDPTPTDTPPLSSLVDWHVGTTEGEVVYDWRVGTTDGGPYYVRLVLTSADEARAWAAWLLALPSVNQEHP